jgi:choline kinase/phosphatidylglycerophosphate synthase
LKALILAADVGSQLEKLTKQKPKALLPIAGVSLLGRVLRSLREAGIQEAWIVTGYKAHLIREEIGTNYAGLKIHYINAQNWENGELHTLLAARETFKTFFMLCMCDVIFDPEIGKILQQQKPKSTVVLAIDRKSPTPNDTKVLEQNEMIINIGKAINPFNCVNTGLFLCSPKIFEYAEEAVSQGATQLVEAVRAAASHGDARIVDVTGHHWMNIDTPSEFEDAKRFLVKGTQKKRGASDLIAHYVNRPLENMIIYHLSDLQITPNQLTIATNLLAWLVTYLFFTGHLLAGSILTFAVGVMDGLDGKLARIRQRETKLGRMEHAFDLLFEFSWLVALAFFLSKTKGLLPLQLCALSLMFIAFYRFCYDQFSRTMNVSLDVYGRFERIFRRVAGRRNLYNIHIFLGVVFDVPLYALFTIMIHSAITAVVYAYRASLHMYKADQLSTGALIGTTERGTT